MLGGLLTPCKINILRNDTDSLVFEWFVRSTDHMRSDQSNGKEALHLLRKEIGWDGLEWIHQAHDRDKRRAHENTVMNLSLP